MSQRCFKCGGNKKFVVYYMFNNIPCYSDCNTCNMTGQISIDFMACSKCRGRGCYDTYSSIGNIKTTHDCMECNKTGILKKPEAIQRDKQIAEQQAKIEAEKRAAAIRLQQEQEKVRKANLDIQQKNEQITQLKQREATLLQKIQQNQAVIAKMEVTGQTQQQNYIELTDVLITYVRIYHTKGVVNPDISY